MAPRASLEVKPGSTPSESLGLVPRSIEGLFRRMESKAETDSHSAALAGASPKSPLSGRCKAVQGTQPIPFSDFDKPYKQST